MSRIKPISVSLILICAVLAAGAASAQLDKGLVAGWNHSSWSYDDPNLPDDFFQAKNGYCFGLYGSGTLSGDFGWRGELLYTRKGAKSVQQGTDENGVPTGDIDYFYNVDYLEIPAVATWTIPTRGGVRPVLLLGPALGIKLKSELDAQYPTGIKYAFSESEELEEVGTTDFSLVFGGGVDIDAGHTVVNVQIRYVLGLKEVYRSTKNRTLSVMAGIGI